MANDASRSTAPSRPVTLLFACVHNAGRSQMAAAIFNALADPALARGISAGTEPAQRVHPEVVETMREIGIDLSGARPRKLTDELAREASMLVTMGCGEACPHVPGLTVVDWEIPDPKGRPPEDVRVIRETVQACVVRLIHAHGWEKPVDSKP
jgi:arsenate reductase (thioredoxin)